jgi:hypothetical protein
MRKHLNTALLCGLLLGGTAALSAQAPQNSPETTPRANTPQQSAERTTTDKDATYGRVKEFTAGQKLVIDVDNAPDKSYDLAKDKDVVMAPGLKVGDPVKITESDVNGKKTVNIAMENNPNVQHGDKTQEQERR